MAGKYEREFEEEEPGRLEKSRRGYWANKAEFILACFGNAWGATAWVRFPYLCYANGGLLVFMIAYLVMLSHIGIPMVLLEMSLGQYGSQGILSVWRLCPLFMGVGVSILLIGCFALSYLMPNLSWLLYYFYVSFTSDWATCDNAWNTPKCAQGFNQPDPPYEFLNTTTCEDRSYRVEYDGFCYNDYGDKMAIHDDYTYRTQSYGFSPAQEEYYSNFFLQGQGSPDFQFIGRTWTRFICLAVLWVVIALCLCVGVRSLGKVVYFTSTVPFILLIAFLIRALTLPGASDGMQFLFVPDFSKLLTPSLWTAAASEAIFGLGLGYGGYLTLASYNRFQNYFAFDAVFVVLIHVLVRIATSVIVLGFAGYLAYSLGMEIGNIMTSGPRVIYVMIPQALSTLPAAPAWCFFFFLLVFIMQLGGALVLTEVVSTAICDLWRPLLRLRFVLVGILSSAFFLIGILFCTSAGHVLFLSLDLHMYFADIVIVCAMSVCAAVFYGICWMRYDIALMLGGRHICLMIVAGLILIPAAIHWFLIPLSTITLLVYSAIEYHFPSNLPEWTMYVGFSLMGVVLLPMLLCPIILFIIACCRSCRCGPVVRPNSKWGPHLSRNRVRATHLPHINISPLTVEGVKLDRMAPIARYDI